MDSRFGNAAMVAIALCCLTVTAIAIRRETQAPKVRAVTAEPEKVSDWKAYASGGNHVGTPNAGVTIVEFSDYQCPFCKKLHETLRELRQKYGADVRIVFHHHPLQRIHPHARAAALASECAAAAGRFSEFSDVVYGAQDSIGLIPWSVFAARAQITDTVVFGRCLRDSLYVTRLRDDEELGKALRVTGTPTVLVNEWRIKGGAKELLMRLIDQELGKSAAQSVSNGRP